MPEFEWYKELTINSSLIGSDLTGFVARLELGADDDLRSVANGGGVRSANGYDIAFYSDIALTTQYPHELVSYDDTTGEAAFWVRVPATAASDQSILMLYGEATITTDQSSTDVYSVLAADVGSSVYHLDDLSGDLVDATANGHDLDIGADFGATLAGEVYGAEGKIGTAMQTDASSWNNTLCSAGAGVKVVDRGTQPFEDRPFTVSTWFRSLGDNGGVRQYILEVGQTSGRGFAIQQAVAGSGTSDPIRVSGSSSVSATFDVAGTYQPDLDLDWVLIHVTFDGVDDWNLYENGVLATNWTHAVDVSMGGDQSVFTILGSRETTRHRGMWGRWDEARILFNNELSADWIAAEHANQDDSTIDAANFWKSIGAQTQAQPDPFRKNVNTALARVLDVNCALARVLDVNCALENAE